MTVSAAGNFMFIIKPGDTSVLEGKILTGAPPLELLQFGVGGLIEIVPRFNKFGGRPCIAFCNEEGKLNGLPVNYLAQQLWEEACGRAIREDHLVGNIVVIVGSTSFLKRM
jgi:Domain of unknown function (DUF3846)